MRREITNRMMGAVMKVAVVDDQKLWLSGLKMILNATDGIEVIWTAENGEMAVFMCKENKPDVLLMDIRMPVMDGVEATRQILFEQSDIKILVLTTFDDDAYIYEMLKYGASGYLLKESEPEVIVKAIENVNMGGLVMDQSVANKVLKHMEPMQKSDNLWGAVLSQRERDIANCISEGLNNKEIAERLCVSEGTVKNHLTNVLEKLNLRDRTQLAIFVLKSKGL